MKRAALIALLLIACAKPEAPKDAASTTKPAPPLPTAEQAKEIVANSSDFGEYQFTNAAVTLPMKKSAMNEPAKQLASELRTAGWIAFSGDAIVLSSKASNDKRFLVRPNGFIDIVPLAKKEFGAVTNVRASSEGADVDFTWKWIRNEIGTAIGKPADGEQHAVATLFYDGTSWSVLRIR